MTNLPAAEERWRLTIDNAPVGIALVSLEGQFMRVNDALCSMLGYEQEQLHELTWQRITHPEDLADDQTQLGQLVAGEIAGYRMRKRYLHRDGHVVWANLSVGLVHRTDGSPLHFVSHVADVSAEVTGTSRLAEVRDALHERLEAALHELVDVAANAGEPIDSDVRERLDRLGETLQEMQQFVSELDRLPDSPLSA